MTISESPVNAIQAFINELHERFSGLDEGEPAGYIPELAKANPRDFGIVIATVDGRIYEAGDAHKPFTIQSISKPFVYGLALKLISPERMFSKVGVEPSGEAFNAISLDPVSGIPRNPMINAGAIATAAQIAQFDPLHADRIVLDFFSSLAGRTLSVDEDTFRSERSTGHRNRAIGHLLRNFEIIENDPEPSLDLYFRQCSISVTCKDLAVMAATLACKGRNPFTGEQPLSSDIVIKILALMSTCGTYDFAGQWLYDVGMPAKSGVGGGILAVVPGRLGIAIYSPPLDRLGNSVRGIAVCNAIAEGLELSLFNQYPQSNSTIRSCCNGSQRQSRLWRTTQEADLLLPKLDKIRIISAQGILDFAAVERLVFEMNQSLGDAQVLVLDLAYVISLPASSKQFLDRELTILMDSGTITLLARAKHLNLQAGDGPNGLHGISDSFDHLDRAIERAEDILLSSLSRDPVDSSAAEIDQNLGFLSLLQPQHRQTLASLMQRRVFQKGDQVIRMGDPGQELFLVGHGKFTTAINVEKADGSQFESRLATFGHGMCFGEIAFLSGQPRTANVTADQDGSCWVLLREDFDALRERDPKAAIELMLALTRDLGRKLAFSSYQLTLLEHF